MSNFWDCGIWYWNVEWWSLIRWQIVAAGNGYCSIVDLLQTFASRCGHDRTDRKFSAAVLGQILLYDLRSSRPSLVKDHNYCLPIKDVEFHRSQNLVLSCDSRILKIWDEHTVWINKTPLSVYDCCYNFYRNIQTNAWDWNLVMCEYSKFRIESNSYFSIRFDSKRVQIF